MPKEEIHVSVFVVVEKDGDGFHAYAPALKGLHVDGETEDQAEENAKEAIDVYLQSLLQHNEPLPVGDGLTVLRRKVTRQTWLKNVTTTTQWPLPNPSGINSEIALQTT